MIDENQMKALTQRDRELIKEIVINQEAMKNKEIEWYRLKVSELNKRVEILEAKCNK